MGKPTPKSKSRSETESMSKADKKFEKKLEFYAKVRDTVAALGAKKDIKKKKKLRSRQKKLKPYDLSNLSEFLPELKSQEQHPIDDVKLIPKNMQKLILKEGNRLTTVLKHQAFQSDPFGAIHQHLLSTQPVVDEEPKQKMKNKGTKAKRKRSKASSGPQSMDI